MSILWNLGRCPLGGVVIVNIQTLTQVSKYGAYAAGIKASHRVFPPCLGHVAEAVLDAFGTCYRVDRQDVPLPAIIESSKTRTVSGSQTPKVRTHDPNMSRSPQVRASRSLMPPSTDSVPVPEGSSDAGAPPSSSVVSTLQASRTEPLQRSLSTPRPPPTNPCRFYLTAARRSARTIHT